METGQLFMMQMPAVTAKPATAALTSSNVGAQGDNPFVGMLQALSQNAKSLNDGTKAGTAKTTADDSATPGTLVKDAEKKQPDILIPQEAVLSAAGAQIALALPTTGRMLELEDTVNNQISADAADGTDAKSIKIGNAQPDMSFQNLQALSSKLAEAVTLASPETEGTPAPTSEKSETGQQPMLSVEQNVQQGNQSKILVANQIVKDVNGVKNSQEGRAAAPTFDKTEPVKITTPAVEQSVLQGDLKEISPTAVEAQKIPVQQFMEAYSRPVASVAQTTTTATAVQESSITQTAVKSQNEQVEQKSVTTQVDTASIGNTVKTADVLATPTRIQDTQNIAPASVIESEPKLPQVMDGNLRAQHATESGMNTAHLAARHADARPELQEELGPQQTTKTSDVKAAAVETMLAGAVKQVASTTAGDESTGGDKPANDQAVNIQFHQNLQQQSKLESVPTENSTTPASSSALSENVAKQLGERLAGHEIKTGSEQIVLRLSPENLGELKVNLRMENQRLTVEIVAENRTVRDALVQNSDSLKESLAKQNIKMDSFDVSTGGNNGGMAGRGQSDWRELAQQRQNNVWMADNGYRLPMVAAVELPPAYQSQSAHSLVDVHY